VQHSRLDVSKLEALAVLEQMVELAAVAYDIGRVEHGPEDLLYLADMLADPDLGAGLALDIGRARQMVGMGVGLQHPIDRQSKCFCLIEDDVGRLG